MTPPEERVPDEFIDARNIPGYNELSAYHKLKAMKTFEQRVLSFLRAPMNEAGFAKMLHHQNWIRVGMREEGDRLSRREIERVCRKMCTVERIAEACVDFAVSDFYFCGVAGYCLDVILRGWENFDMHGSGSCRSLMSSVTGHDFF
jgi:hypothetical protein